jgi:hypothetical protein
VAYDFQQPVTTQHVLDLAGDGRRSVLAAVTCLDTVESILDNEGAPTPIIRGEGVLVIERHPTGGLRAIDLVPVPLDRRLSTWTFERGRLSVSSFRVSDGGEGPTQRWVWNGAYFQPEA